MAKVFVSENISEKHSSSVSQHLIISLTSLVWVKKRVKFHYLNFMTS